MLWSPIADHLITIVRGTLHEVGLGSLKRPIAAAFIPGSQELEAVDAEQRKILRFDKYGTASELELFLPIQIETAARTSDGWWIAGTDSTAAYSVFFAEQDGSARQLLRTAADEHTSLEHRGIRMSASGKNLLLSIVHPPFSTFVLRSDVGVQQEFAPNESWPPVTVDDFSADVALWIALPAIALEDSSFVQMIADLKSDRRLLFLFDAQGSVVRHAAINVPLGFVGSVPNRPVLIAVRRLSTQEVVLYEYD